MTTNGVLDGKFRQSLGYIRRRMAGGGGREQVWKEVCVCVWREETYVCRSVGRSVGERMSCNNVLPTQYCVRLGMWVMMSHKHTDTDTDTHTQP